MKRAAYLKALQASGLRQVDLCNALGVHVTTASRWGDEIPVYVAAFLDCYGLLSDVQKEHLRKKWGIA